MGLRDWNWRSGWLAAGIKRWKSGLREAIAKVVVFF
jgi:hypothetical protein